MNLYYNNISSSQKIFEYVNTKKLSKYFNVCYLMIKDFWKELYTNKELVYKIIKYGNKEELKNSQLNFFFTQNFYIDLFSNSNDFPNELYYIINKLINDLVLNLEELSEYSQIYEESNLALLLDGMILNDKIRSFFNLILSEIVEEYEKSEENMHILLFKVEDIKKHFKNQEEKLKQELLNSTSPKKSEIKKKKERQNTILNMVYRMKIPNIQKEKAINENYIGIDLDEDIDKDYKNNEVFSCKYLPELNKNDLIEILNNEKKEIMKSYIRSQIILIESDYNVYSNKKFLENIQKSAGSEKILYFYQKSFMITINIITKIFKRLNENIEIIPEEIKIISIMIMKSLKNKFGWITDFEIYKFISEFFIRLFKAFFLFPDYNALINSVILSKKTKDNLQRIYNVLNKLISGKFFTNSEEECDYTPFNLFFLEFNPQIFAFYSKLLEDYNFNSKIENIENIKDKNLNNTKNIITISIIYSVEQITSLLNIINNNYKIFFDYNENNNSEKEKELIKDFLKTFQKLKDNEELFINLIKKGKEKNKIFFFAYNEIVYSQKIQDILNRDKKQYFKILELKDDKTTEEVNINKIIRAKNLFFDLLYISPKLSKFPNIAEDSKGKNTKEILIQLNKFFKSVSNYNGDKTKDNNIIDTDDNINNNEKSKLPKDWYINSLIICLENLDKEYSKNDYKKLYKSIKEDLTKSISNYDFDELSKILRDLKAITIFKYRFINLQEKNKNVAINLKIREFIEFEPIEVKILFIYNSSRKIFNITKMDNNVNDSLNGSLNNSLNSSTNNNKNNIINKMEEKYSIKCFSINDFIKKFPNFSLIQQRQDIDLFLIEREVNLSYGLNQYFKNIY